MYVYVDAHVPLVPHHSLFCSFHHPIIPPLVANGMPLCQGVLVAQEGRAWVGPPSYEEEITQKVNVLFPASCACFSLSLYFP